MYDFLVFQSVFRLFHDFLLFHLLLSSLLFSSLLSSLLFSSLFSCLVSPLTYLFCFFSFSSSLFSSLVSFSSFLFLFLFLSFVFSFLSLSSFSVCWWCVCRRVCRRVCLCVSCGTLKKRGNNQYLASKTPPCVDSKRPRVCRQHAHMLFSMCAWCRHTRGRFESTHGGVFESTHGWSSPVQFTKKSRT